MKSASPIVYNPLGAVVGEALGLLIALLILTILLPLLPIITPAYKLWLPIGINTAILSAVSRTVGHLIPPVKPLTYIAAHLFGIYSTYYLIKYYPFNFAAIGLPIIDQILPLALAFAVVIMTITAIVQLFRWLFSFSA